MEKYGRIKEDGSLSQSSKPLDGYKLLRHEKIPESFNQESEYVIQCDPVEKDDYIFIGIEIHELEIEDEEFEDELF